MTDPVNARILAQETPRTQTLFDLPRRHTGTQQLGTGDDAMRSTTDPAANRLNRPALTTHYGV